MQIKTIHAGNFKLDGGAMFGVVPKTIWSSLNAADENNMCNWAMRCLLVEDGDRIILIDNGIGDKQSQKFFGYYHLNGEDSLEKSLNRAGVGLDDITDVVLTHLHFDHCGGSLKWNSGKTFLEPTFKNATYWSQQQHWDHAMTPNPREKPSFLKENFEPLSLSGQLKMVGEDLVISPNMKVRVVSGHTEKMMCPIINYKQKTLVYVADLIPSSAHVPVHYVMAYDIRPLDTMTEKNLFLEEAVNNDYTLFFEHDLNVECGKVIQTERGFKLGETFDLTAFI
jgi:glyoxylase-like metal-dependent hydrolase (beta-lactamase superfamily II)